MKQFNLKTALELYLKSVNESIVVLWGAIQEVTTVASGYPLSMSIF